MQTLPRIIGIAGNATCGKDTFFKIAQTILVDNYPKIERFAFADALKDDLCPLLASKMGIDVYDPSKEEKDLVRPVMVAYGIAQRNRTKGEYWIQRVEEQIYGSDADLCFVTDVRFTGGEGDEYGFINRNGGLLIYIEKFYDNGSICPPANENEEINNQNLKRVADIVVRWRHLGSDDIKSDLKETVSSSLNTLSQKWILSQKYES